MIEARRQGYVFQSDWTGRGERGLRDFLIIPAIFFGAVSPGLFIVSALGGYVAGLWVSIALSIVGYGLTHMLYLGRMERFWRAVLNLRTSWISRGFLFNALFTGFGVLYAASASGIISISGPASGALMFAAVLSAIAFAAYPGFMLMKVKAIAFWQSQMEPIIFFLQAILGGLALAVLLMAVWPQAGVSATALLKMNFLLLIAIFALLMSTLVVKAIHGGSEEASVVSLTQGEFSPVFLGAGIGMGLVAPMFVLASALLLPLDIGTYGFIYYFTMVLELIGIYVAKQSILRAGTYSPIK